MKLDEIGRHKSVQVTQRRPIHDPRPFSDRPLPLDPQPEMGREGRTDSKLHSSWGSEPIPSQNALSLAINSLIEVVTCSAV